MKSRLITVVCIIVIVLILESGAISLASGASVSGIVLTKAGQIETGDAYDVWVDTDNDIAYVTCGYSGVKIFDVSNHHNPIEVAHVPSSSDGYAHQLAMHENLMFIADGRGGLKIIDCENWSNPVVLSQYINHYAWGVEVIGDTAFVANGLPTGGGRLTVVNVTDPAAPALLGDQPTLGGATDIEVVGNLAFLTTGYGGFTVFDVTNHTDPVQLGRYAVQGNRTELGDLEIVGDMAYLSYWRRSFRILNISDISNIGVVAEFNESQGAFSVYIERERNLAFLCDLELGLLLFDIHIPSQPSEVTRYFDGGKPNRVVVVGDLVYMTDQVNGFVILEIEENNILTTDFGLLLLVVAVPAILALGWWLKKSRTSGHGVEGN